MTVETEKNILINNISSELKIAVSNKHPNHKPFLRIFKGIENVAFLGT